MTSLRHYFIFFSLKACSAFLSEKNIPIDKSQESKKLPVGTGRIFPPYVRFFSSTAAEIRSYDNMASRLKDMGAFLWANKNYVIISFQCWVTGLSLFNIYLAQPCSHVQLLLYFSIPVCCHHVSWYISVFSSEIWPVELLSRLSHSAKWSWL